MLKFFFFFLEEIGACPPPPAANFLSFLWVYDRLLREVPSNSDRLCSSCRFGILFLFQGALSFPFMSTNAPRSPPRICPSFFFPKARTFLLSREGSSAAPLLFNLRGCEVVFLFFQRTNEDRCFFSLPPQEHARFPFFLPSWQTPSFFFLFGWGRSLSVLRDGCRFFFFFSLNNGVGWFLPYAHEAKFFLLPKKV